MPKVLVTDDAWPSLDPEREILGRLGARGFGMRVLAYSPSLSIAELQTKAATNVADVLSGRLPATVVNPGVRELTVYRAGL